jgi:hypothetical protein
MLFIFLKSFLHCCYVRINFMCTFASVELHTNSEQRDQWGVASGDHWNWDKWGLMEYIWKGSFPGWLVEIFVLPWLLKSAQNKLFFSHLTVHAQQAGQADVPGILSLNVCLWYWKCLMKFLPLSLVDFSTCSVSPYIIWCWKKSAKHLHVIGGFLKVLQVQRLLLVGSSSILNFAVLQGLWIGFTEGFSENQVLSEKQAKALYCVFTNKAARSFETISSCRESIDLIL